MDIGKITFVAAIILQIVIRYPYRGGAQKKVTDRQEQVVLGLLTVGGLLIPLIYILTGWLSFADYPAPPWVMWLGVAVMALGLWLFWRSHADLGRSWSSTLEIHDDHALVTQGVYQRVRHPMYSANWLMMLAHVLLFPNWIAGTAGLLAFAVMYFSRVQKEEAMMLDKFGDEYKSYMDRTGRVFPKVG